MTTKFTQPYKNFEAEITSMGLDLPNHRFYLGYEDGKTEIYSYRNN